MYESVFYTMIYSTRCDTLDTDKRVHGFSQIPSSVTLS